ncbi:uncharacterized protein SPPG_05469 [Spizellomyces punctatus DAOM BR117]|uniref:G-patch domain-containing protein n=1 Tax=Spizellomyces punctatus (strain DAOM BR117) TaxID=645134 RepID=A0A0L0HEN3_SPIPD|nr:uncharacterized protein SPPG_05469 [Spizellomyces punctatus DAOM BR117]KNC99213.1 hypothetical protein SPPG_05469 [Spizellomyces punctatus DAOM BR117]|eukprot:XP_016607253.1 hypothetical protein SPPG_05469 [Spizellomyces punctatus DAOM BR117]
MADCIDLTIDDQHNQQSECIDLTTDDFQEIQDITHQTLEGDRAKVEGKERPEPWKTFKALTGSNPIPFVLAQHRIQDAQKAEHDTSSAEIYRLVISNALCSSSVKPPARTSPPGPYYCQTCNSPHSTPVEIHSTSIPHLLSLSPGRSAPNYGLDATNKGFQMLQDQGWTYGTGLGVDEQGRQQPIATRLKRDRRGVGGETGRKRVTHTLVEAHVERVTKKRRKELVEKERNDRKELLAYMNS